MNGNKSSLQAQQDFLSPAIKKAPDEPSWDLISGAAQKEFPYECIGRVFSGEQSIGTAVKTNHGILTAAHVARAGNIECVFPNGQIATFDGSGDIHPGYFGDFGTTYPGSEFDLALLRPVSGDWRSALAISENQSPSSVSVIGFSQNKSIPMTRHLAPAWQIQEHIGHKVHTHKGHSGAPMLGSGFEVIGLHLGGIGVLSDYYEAHQIYQNAQQPPGDFDNCGLIFRAHHLSFLNGRMATNVARTT